MPRVVECVVLRPGGLQRVINNICDAREESELNENTSSVSGLDAALEVERNNDVYLRS